MKLKSSLAVLGAGGAATAVLFGGTAVHTALTSDTPDSVGTSGATVAGSLAYGPALNWTNLQPGEEHAVNYGLHNTGSVPEEAYWVPNGFNATAGDPNVNDIVLGIQTGNPAYPDGYIPLPVKANGTPVSLGVIPANSSKTVGIVWGLKQSAGNSWNGAGGTDNYTIHFQDVNGTDANGYVATKNN